MAAIKSTDKNILFLLFPNASPTVHAIGGKLLRVLSEAAASVNFVSSEIPESVKAYENVKRVEMGIRMHRVDSRSPRMYSVLTWIAKYVYIQFRMGLEVIRQRNHTDVIICFLASHYQVPVLIGRMLGKHIICGATGVATESAAPNYNSIVVWGVRRMMQVTYDLADEILIEGLELSRNPALARWADKMVFGALYFGDAELFTRNFQVSTRPLAIGFIGRLSAEKGILNFVEALPEILDQLPEVEVLIAGSGGLDGEVRERVEKIDLEERVQILNWVNYEELPSLYNQLKLVVIPSYTEGLPNTMLEAMSCGTPVLASAVGGIPGVIEEGITGYLLPGNSSKEIAEKVIEVLRKGELLDAVSEKALARVHEVYSFEASVARYRRIFLKRVEEKK